MGATCYRWVLPATGGCYLLQVGKTCYRWVRPATGGCYRWVRHLPSLRELGSLAASDTLVYLGCSSHQVEVPLTLHRPSGDSMLADKT